MEPKQYVIDFEYNQTTNKNLNLVCCAIYDPRLKTTESWWLHKDKEQYEDLKGYIEYVSEFEDAIFIAHNVVAEASAFLALGLNPKEYKWLDTFVEFRMASNHNHKVELGEHLFDGKIVKVRRDVRTGKPNRKLNHGLAQLLYWSNKKILDTEHKTKMRDLIISAPKKFTTEEREAIIEYCRSDVKYLYPGYLKLTEEIKKRLGRKASSSLMEEMLWRGETMARTAMMERVGYPIKHTELRNFAKQVPMILKEVQKDINKQFPDILPFELNKKTNKYVLKQLKVREWIKTLDKKIVDRWDKTETQQLSLSYDAFKKFFQFRHHYPRLNFGAQMVRYLHLKQGLNGFIPSTGRKSLWDFCGKDKRVRPYLNPYGSQSARYQPGAISFLFLRPAWIRGMVHPPKGKMIVGMDYSSEEFLLSAIISNDSNMVEAYRSGDVYTAFGKDAGLIPKEGNKTTHPKERQMCKSTVLGLSYSMSKFGLAPKLTQDTGETVTEDQAEDYITLFNETYSDNFSWKKQLQEDYTTNGFIRLSDGWTMFADNANVRSSGNMPIQGEGSCILRKAVQLCQDAGITVIIPLHDALYIECELNDWETVDKFRECMFEAFHFYFTDKVKKEWAKLIGIDIEAWGEGINKDVKTPKGFSVFTEEQHLDPRSKEEYESFKKYFGTPQIDLI